LILPRASVFDVLFAVARAKRGDPFRRAAWNASVVVARPPIFVAPDGFVKRRLPPPPPSQPAGGGSRPWIRKARLVFH
jgi:hypothetical protein